MEPERKQQWFDEFLYIFNKHWTKIDNFRLDKFLSLIRLQVHELLAFLTSEPAFIHSWYQDRMLKFFLATYNEGQTTKEGIPLQICDVFIAELNKVCPDCSLDNIAALLQPFLYALGQLDDCQLKNRIKEVVFTPLLENNKTERVVDEEEEEERLRQAEYKHRYVDGAKLPPRTQKEIDAVLDTKYVFSAFNILLYA